MKKVIAFFCLVLMLPLCACALAEDVLYTASVTKAMTIRASKSTSAR